MSKKRLITASGGMVLTILLLASLTTTLLAQGGGSLDLPWFSVYSGGGWSSAGSFALFGGIGQPDASNASVGGSFSLQGGAIFPPLYHSPTAVTLAELSAHQSGDHIEVAWETLAEINSLGFDIWRGLSASAPSERLNQELIPSQGPGSSQGFSYTWQDHSALPTTPYYYWLDAVDLSGAATRHGPVTALIELPVAVRLTNLTASAAPPLLRTLYLVGAGLALLASGAAWRSRRRAADANRSGTRGP